MPGLKVVALISGGKDSFFSILHCLANGHEVVALANLYPPLENGKQSEDIDSFMYQTVGHAVIPLYEKALGLPLYRQEILGSAVDSNKSYATPQAGGQAAASADETESLVPLLRKVMAAHPEINAVSTGAILSDYQRTRVESVAIRLGLIPLSYLWQYLFLPPYSETSLLDDMAAVGLDARIIKVASGGLDDSFLWENVAHQRTKGRLIKAMQRFGTLGDGAAVGEGGEFETLAVDGPAPLWKSSVHVDAEDRLVSLGDAGVSSLQLRNVVLIEKDTIATETMAAVLGRLRKPTLMDDKFVALQSRLRGQEGAENLAETSYEDDFMSSSAPVDFVRPWTRRANGNTLVLSNCTSEGADAAEQMRNIMARIVKECVVPSSIAFTTILLRSMADFGGVNAAYGAAFTSPSPPARVTIACGDALPAGVDISLSVIALNEAAQKVKQGLHVQSQSYWAPANIGPYSQAISVPTEGCDGAPSGPSMVYVAGQIPLIPTEMAFPQKGTRSAEEHFTAQAVLSLQHSWRIGQITNISIWLGTVAFISRRTDLPSKTQVKSAIGAWKFAHSCVEDINSDEDEDEDIDVWDRAHGHHQSHSQAGTATQTRRPEIQTSLVPPCFVAEVDELPRSAPIEWASVGLAAPSSQYNMHGHHTAISTNQKIKVKHSGNTITTANWITLKEVPAGHLVPSDVGLTTDKGGVCTIYTTRTLPLQDIDAWLSPQIIPCHRIWDADGNDVLAVIAVRSS